MTPRSPSPTPQPCPPCAGRGRGWGRPPRGSPACVVQPCVRWAASSSIPVQSVQCAAAVHRCVCAGVCVCARACVCAWTRAQLAILLAGMLTAKRWEEITHQSPDHLRLTGSEDEKERTRRDVELYAAGIMQVCVHHCARALVVQEGREGCSVAWWCGLLRAPPRPLPAPRTTTTPAPPPPLRSWPRCPGSCC